MKKYTDDQIVEKCKEIWEYEQKKELNELFHFNISVYKNTDTEVKIEFSSMYEPPGLSFSKLKQLSEFFDTENINDDDKFSNKGCETCDYGSSYGFYLTFRQ